MLSARLSRYTGSTASASQFTAPRPEPVLGHGIYLVGDRSSFGVSRFVQYLLMLAFLNTDCCRQNKAVFSPLSVVSR